ncbi:AIR synthase related protein [Anaerobacillus sp. MEB173]|uniref:AIR synthase related protein n=1 Tax=Anaerobacillus sp. MEB173 TaxID=3383345 RepID=UPI003F938A09
MRDLLFLPLQNDEEIVISTDCSGATGLKEADEVRVPYDVVSYYGFRVALMELLAVGAEPLGLVIQNLVNDHVWEELIRGARKACTEIGFSSVQITGSSETNFPLLQSAAGFTVIGKVDQEKKRVAVTPKDATFAVIGSPLVGERIITEQEKVVPLAIFSQLINMEGVYEALPVGSKGIGYELEQLLAENAIQHNGYRCELDLSQSAGPATCFIISFSKEKEAAIRAAASQYFFRVCFNN